MSILLKVIAAILLAYLTLFSMATFILASEMFLREPGRQPSKLSMRILKLLGREV